MLVWLALLVAIPHASANNASCCALGQASGKPPPHKSALNKICPRGSKSQPDFLYSGQPHHGRPCMTALCTAGILTFAGGNTSKSVDCRNGQYQTDFGAISNKPLYTCCLRDGDEDREAEIEFPTNQELAKMRCNSCNASLTFDPIGQCPSGFKAQNHLVAGEARHAQKCPVFHCNQGSLTLSNWTGDPVNFVRCSGDHFETDKGEYIGTSASGACCVKPRCDSCKPPLVPKGLQIYTKSSSSIMSFPLKEIPADESKGTCQTWVCEEKHLKARPQGSQTWYKVDRVECHENTITKPIWNVTLADREGDIDFDLIDIPYMVTCEGNAWIPKNDN